MSGRASGAALRSERGSAVAEFAIALPAVLLVLAMVLGGVQLGVLQVRLQDAAADAARTLGRGDGASAVAARLARQVPSASWSSSRSGELVCVRLSASADGVVGGLGLAAAASSCAMVEAASGVTEPRA